LAKWFLSNALGGVKLQVLKIYQNDAQIMIKFHINGEYEDALKHEFTQLESNFCLSAGLDISKANFCLAY